jgi:hypothetical protein
MPKLQFAGGTYRNAAEMSDAVVRFHLFDGNTTLDQARERVSGKTDAELAAECIEAHFEVWHYKDGTVESELEMASLVPRDIEDAFARFRSAMSPIDYRKILIAYIEHVGACEGVCFLPSDSLRDVLSEAELAALYDAAEEAGFMPEFVEKLRAAAAAIRGA